MHSRCRWRPIRRARRPPGITAGITGSKGSFLVSGTRNLEIKLLRTFMAVVDCGGFTRAGERLHMTQSSVSNQIKRLEEYLGSRLLERDGKGATLTESGRSFQAYARRLVSLNDEALTHIVSHEVSGRVNLGIIEELAGAGFAGLLGQFNQRHPDITLEFVVDLSRCLLDRLEKGEIDLVVAKHVPDRPDDGVLLKCEDLVWVSSEKFPVRINGSIPLIVSPAPCIHRKAMLDSLEARQLTWHIACHAPTLSAVRTAVLSGIGISALDESTVSDGMRKLDERDGLPKLPRSEILLYQSANGSSAVKLFADMLQQSYH